MTQKSNAIAQNHQNMIYVQNHLQMQRNHEQHQQQQQSDPNRIYLQTDSSYTYPNQTAAAAAAPLQRDFENTNPNRSFNHHQTDGGGSIYERGDKQIYRCSTLKPSTGNMVRGGGGGQYENGKSSFGAKPSILNFPLPAIPIGDTGESERKEKVQYAMSRLVFL